MVTNNKDNIEIKKKRKNSSEKCDLRGRGEHSIRIFLRIMIQ